MNAPDFQHKLLDFNDLAVVINVHHEKPHQLMECLQRIKQNLPGALIQVFGNDCHPCLADVCNGMHISFQNGENFGNNELWYLWWERMLSWFVSTKRNVLLKLDPDSMVDRPPTFIPTADYFGCLDDWFIQGGCTGISKQLAAKIIKKDMLTPSKAGKVRVAHKAFADDKYIARMIIDLGGKPYAWTEVRSQWRVPISNEDYKYAIVHPRYYDN